MKKTVIILSFTDEMEADFRSLFQGHTAVLLSLRYGKAIDRWNRSDQMMTAIEKEVCYTHRSQEEGTYHGRGGVVGHWSRSGDRGRGGNWARAFTMISMGRTRRDR